MTQTRLLKSFIPISLILLVAYFSYSYFLKDIFLNNKTQTIKIENLSKNQHLEIKKHDGQSNISSLEIEVKGKSNQDLIILIGPSKQSMFQTISLKSGNIDFETSVDWSQDNCFLLIPASVDANPHLVINYRFIHSVY